MSWFDAKADSWLQVDKSGKIKESKPKTIIKVGPKKIKKGFDKMVQKLEFHKEEPKVKQIPRFLYGNTLLLSPLVVLNAIGAHWWTVPLTYLVSAGLILMDTKWGEKILSFDSYFRNTWKSYRESVIISKTLRDSFSNANLIVKEKVGKDTVIHYPAVDIAKDDYNYYLTIHMLPGQTSQEWENRSTIFSNSLSSNLVKYEMKKGVVEVVLQHTEMKSQGVTYKKDNEHSMDVGYFSGGKLKWNFDEDPHMLIVGMTGTGKSTFLRNLFVQFQRDWNVSVVDGKFVEFTMLKKFGFNVASTVEEFKKVIDEAWVEVDRRFKMLQEAEKNHYSQLGLQPYFLVIDEFIYVAESFGAKKKDKEELWSSLKDIAVRGRAAGVNMVLILQRPDAEFLPTLVRDNVSVKVVLGSATETAYEMAFGSENKKLNPLAMGEGYSLIRKDLINFSFSNYELDKFLEDMQWSRREYRPGLVAGATEAEDGTA